MSSVGLDLGTSRVKAVRLGDDGTVLATAAEDTVVDRPRPGWSEQDPEQVWQAAARVLAAVADDTVTTVAVTGQGDGCWLVDVHDRPARPAVLWNDNRAAGQVDAWDADGVLDEVFAVTGCDGAPGLAHAVLRWLDGHDPAALARSDALLSCAGWVFLRLTGERVVHLSDAHNPFLGIDGAYDDRLLATLGLADHRRLLPRPVAGADAVAALRPPVAAELGLPSGVQVVVAPYDVVATAVGVGAVAPGEALGILGTTACVGLASDSPRLGRPRGGMSLPFGESPGWLLAYATLSGTEVLDWAAALLGYGDAATLVRSADLDAGAGPDDAPLFLPYLSPAGERAPFRDASARGVLAGLRLTHGREVVAAAVLDGLTFAVRDCLEAVGPVTRLRMAGGGARSERWVQRIADATGRPVSCADTPETGARGAVVAAAVATGQARDLTDAVAGFRPAHTHDPDASLGGRLDERFARYRAARASGAHRL